MQYPKYRYKKCKENGFEAVLFLSKEEEGKAKGEFFDNPAEFDIETHPQRYFDEHGVEVFKEKPKAKKVKS